MREILFRGKRTDNGEWVQGFYVHIPLGRFGKDEHLIQTVCEDGKIGAVFTVIPETVGQYIGIIDEYGEKVFDGDIAVINGGEKLVYVTFDRYYKNRPDGEDIAVIGNINENPELLKGAV